MRMYILRCNVFVHVHKNYMHVRPCSNQAHECMYMYIHLTLCVYIMQAHVVDGALTPLSTFGCVEWESDVCI